MYGELCKPLVLHELLGRVPTGEPAVLRGFSRRLNPRTGYFRAVEQADAVIVGILLGGLDGGDLAALDRFEDVDGGEYRRIAVQVEALATGVECRAWMYVGAEGPRVHGDDGDARSDRAAGSDGGQG